MSDRSTLVVRRTDDHDLKEREIYVSVDGGPNRILRFGDSVTIPLTAGRHRLRAHNTWSRRVAEFDASPGQEVRFRTANVQGKGYMATAVFFGFAFMNTELEREDEAPLGASERIDR